MKTTQDIINEAAEKHSFGVPYDGSQDFYDEKARASFTAGATFALSTPQLWREKLIEYTKWVHKEYGDPCDDVYIVDQYLKIQQ